MPRNQGSAQLGRPRATEIFRTRAARRRSDTEPTVLHASAECRGSAVIVSVRGEVDATNGDAFDHLVTKMAATCIAPGRLVIDIRGAEFLGSCAYAVLAREAKRCRRRGVRLYLISNQSIVEGTIVACGLRWLLPTYQTVDAALCARATARSSEF
jgi:anti-anti-sigma factor